MKTISMEDIKTVGFIPQNSIVNADCLGGYEVYRR